MVNNIKLKTLNKEKTYPKYTPNEIEEALGGLIDTRFTAMKKERQAVDKDWDIYQKMIEAKFEPYPDERSSSTVPLASAMMELYVADATKIKTEFVIKWENSDSELWARVLDHVWKYDFKKNKRKKEFTKAEYTAAWFWTSIMYTWYRSTKKTQKDPIIWEDGELTREENEYTDSKIIVENIDIRNFWLDNTAIDDIDQANDAIYKQWIWYDKFIDTYENDPLYSHIENVAPIQYKTNETYTTKQDDSKSWDFVEITYYWNLEKDIYVERANWIIVRAHPIMSTKWWKKAIPFIIRVLGKKQWVYGRWLCEWLMMFNSEINNLRELLMDGIRRSNTQILALGNWLTFDGRTFAYDNEIMTFDGDMKDFQQISGTPPNQAIFSYLERLYKDIAMFVGIDIQNILWDAQQTAFQTEVQREASQKRINVWLTNRDLAYERFADLYKDLLQTYFPLKDAKWLFPKIMIEWEEYKELDKTIDWEKKKVWRFRKKKGNYMLEVTPEMLRWDIYVDAYTNTTAPTINAVDREQKLQFTNAVWWIVQWYALAKQAWFDIDTILPLKDTISTLAEDFNLTPSGKADTQEVNDAKKKLVQDLMKMKSKPDMPALPTKETNMEQWQQADQWQTSQWQVNPAEQANTQDIPNAPQLK